MVEQIFRVVTTGPYRIVGHDGLAVEVPPGSTVNRVVCDPATPWQPPENTELRPDDGSPVFAPTVPAPATMDAWLWLRRMPDAVHEAVAEAARADPVLLLAMTLIGAGGRVDLADATGQLRAFLDRAILRTAGSAAPMTPAIAARMLAP